MKKRPHAQPSSIIPGRRRSRLLALEPRVLFDGVALHDTSSLDAGNEKADAIKLVEAPALSASPSPTAIREILFIDAKVPEADTLVAHAREGVLVVRLDPAQDALDQITQVLQEQSGLGAVHLVSHGGPGFLSLGGISIDASALAERSDTLAQWQNALAPGADLLLYGCDVAAGETGLAFVSRLADLTGADVNASSDATGATGDWHLETASGSIEAAGFLTAEGIAAYQARLSTISLSGNTGWVPIMIGTAFDPQGDSQAGAADTDIVGNATHAAVYAAYDDGGTPDNTADDFMAFRIRIDNPTSTSYYGGVAILGMDANQDGRIDLFFAVDGRNNGQAVRLLDPGSGANISPNTTTTMPLPTGWIPSNGIYSFSDSNYSVNAVSALTDPHWDGNADLGNDGKTDAFISFKVSMNDIAAVLAKPSPTDRSGMVGPRGTTGIAGFNKDTVVRYVAMTQTQTGPINGDIGGVGRSYDKNSTFADLGAYTAPMSASNPVGAAASVNITDPVDANGLINATEDDALTINGTAAADGWVKLVISDSSGATADITRWVQADAGGTWSVAGEDLSGLADGNLTFTAQLVTANGSDTVVAGSIGDTASAVHDTTGPGIVITPVATAGRPVITGTSTDVPAGSTITVSIDPNGDGNLADLISYTAIVTSGGGWSVNTASSVPVSGTMPATGLTAYAKISAEGRDAAGNPGTATAITRPTVNAQTTNDTTPAITGTWGGSNGGNDSLSVSVNGITYTTAGGALVVTDHSWTLTIPEADALATSGTPYEVTATVTRGGDSASDTSSSELTVVNGPAVTITGGAAASTADATPVITGTTTLPAGSIVIVRIDPNGDDNLADAVTFAATVDANGNWSVDTETAVPLSGSFPVTGISDQAKIRASATDASGASATADQTLNVTAPAINIVTITGANSGTGLLADNILNNAEDDSVTISGTTDDIAAGQLVTLTVSAGGVDKVATGVVQADGSWSVTFSAADANALSGLADGTLTVTASAGGANDSSYIAHDATPPTIRVNAPATLSNNSQVIEGVSDLANGKTVLVTILTSANATITHTVTVNDGKWITPTLSLPAGTTQITVSSTDTDIAGNTATGETVTRTVASNNGFKQPVLSIDTIAGDNVIVTSEISGGLTLSGSYNTESQSVKNGTITVTITGKSLADGSSTTLTKTSSFSNASSGTWSVSLTKAEVEALANGTLTVNGSLTVSGNTANTYALPLLALSNGVGQTIAIDTPIIDGNLSATEDGPGMSISGTATNAASQTINLIVSDTDGTTPDVTGTAVVGPNGTWSVNGLDLSGLADGTLTVTASLGSVTGTATVLHDKTPPLLTVTAGPTAGDATPLIVGTSDLAHGSTVTISIDADNDGNADAAYTATVQADGSWSVNTETATPYLGSFPVTGLGADSKVTVSGSDAAGNTTSLVAASITGINNDTGISSTDFVTKDQTLVFTGKAEAGSSVAVSLDGNAIGTVLADGNGVWTLDHGGTVLTDGTYTLTAVATKSAGLTATATQTFTVDASAPFVAITGISNDTGVSASDFITNDSTLIFSGTAEANSAVQVVLKDRNNATVFSATVTASGGTWSVDRSSFALADGSYTLTATATDSAGNTASVNRAVVIDTSAVIGLTTNYKTSDTTPLITGSTDIEAGRSITIEIDADNNGLYDDGHSYTTTVQADGTWSVEATTALSGAVNVKASGSDSAGNAASATKAMVIDPSAPAITVTEPIGDGDLSATEDDAVIIQGSTSSVPAGGTLHVTITDGTITITDTATAGADGTWTLAPLNLSAMANGTLTVTATYYDDGGISYSDSATVLHNKAGSVSIDSISNDSGAPGDFITSDQTLVFSGSATAGATVTLTLSGPSGGFSNQNVVADANGTWTYNHTGTTLSNGTYTLQAVSGTTVIQTIEIDNAAPGGAVTVASLVTEDTTPTITGTAIVGAGESLSVTVNGVTYSVGDGKLSLDGNNWTLHIPAEHALTPATSLGGFNGVYNVVATIRDAAGNVLSDNTSGELTVQDLTAPVIDLDPGAGGAGDGTGIDHSATSVLGAAVSLDDNGDAATLTEASDKLVNLRITVGGLKDGSNEKLVFGNTTVAADGSSGTQGDITVGGVRINLSYSAGTFTLQKVDYTTLSSSEAQAVLRDIQYLNTAGTVSAGARTFAIVATDDAGRSSASATTTVNVTLTAADTTAPAAPSIDLVDASDTGSSATDDKTSDTTPTFRIGLNGSGATAPVAGDVVRLYEGVTEVGSATLVQADIDAGFVDITASAVTAGDKSFTATISDGTNTSDASSALAATIDTTAPALASATASGTSLVLSYTEAGVGMASTAPAAGDFAVTKNGGTAVNVTGVVVDAINKTVTLTLASAITNADTDVQVSYTPGTDKIQDIAANTAAGFAGQAVTNNSLDTTAPAAPSIDLVDASDTGSSATDDKTSDTTPTFRIGLNGSGATAPVAGDVVRLYEGTTEVGSATLVQADIDAGFVDITASAVTAGDKSFTATISDGTNTSDASSALAVTIDTTAPVLASATVSGTSLVLSYTEAGVGMASTAPAAGDFAVTKNGGTAVNVTGVVVDAVNKTVTLTLASAVTNMDTNVQVSYTPGTDKTQDIAANTAAAFAGQAVANNSPDTTAPATPGIALTQDTGSDGADRITRLGGLTLSGIEADATVEYSVDGINWSNSFTPVEGNNVVQVRQTDAAGNVSAASAAYTFTLDTVVATPGVTLSSDTGNPADGITSNGSLSLSAIEAGAIVEYSVDGINWSNSFAPAEGSNTVQVRQTDLAGNVGAPATISFTLDTSLPAVPTVIPQNTTNTTPVIAGTATLAAGETLTVTVNGASYSVTPVGGTWTLDLSAATPISGVLGSFSAGNSYEVTARVTDAAGNSASDVSSAELSIAATSPSIVPPVVPAPPATPPAMPVTPPLVVPPAPSLTPSETIPLVPRVSNPAGIPSSGPSVIAGPGASGNASAASQGGLSFNAAQGGGNSGATGINLLAGISLPPAAATAGDQAAANLTLSSTDRGFPVSRVQTPAGIPGAASASDVATTGQINSAVQQQKGAERLFVYQGIPDIFARIGRPLDYFVPREAFGHTDPNAIVQLDASLKDGSPLPEWLDFDPVSGRFSGRPPLAETGALEIKVIARDNEGREAAHTFRVQLRSADAAQRTESEEIAVAEAQASQESASQDTQKDKAAGKEIVARKALPFGEQLRQAKPARDPLLARMSGNERLPAKPVMPAKAA